MKHNLRIEVDRIRPSIRNNIGIMLELTAPELKLENQEREPNAVVFVIDRSGSMGNGRLELIKNTLSELIGRLDSQDFLSIVTFDDQVMVNVALTRVGDLNIGDVRRELAGLRPGGGTNLEIGYREGLAEASKAPTAVPSRVVVLSDGHANQGNRDVAALGQLAAAAREHLISTSTLGIGEGFDERLLTSLSEQGYGNHLAAIKVEEAVVGLQDDLRGLLAASVRELKVELTQEGFTGSLAFSVPGPARESSREGTTLKALLGDMAAGEERSFLFNLLLQKADLQPANDIVASVNLSLSWIDVATGENRCLELQSPVTIVADEANWTDPARDEQVMVEMGFFRVQDAKLLAAEEARQGRHQDADRLLSEAKATLSAYMEENPAAMSARQRRMIQSDIEEIDNLMLDSGHGEEFIKRNYESAMRMKMSRLNPRKKPEDKN
jgi:Ca-activated chloride channel family protein